MQAVEKKVQARLFEMQDSAYKAFHSRLIPTVDPDTILGVRTPALRRYARAFAKTPEAEAFLRILPHQYYEENNLHGFLIEAMSDYDRVIEALDAFLPYVDNWATCDSMRPRVFAGHLPALSEQISLWLRSAHPYTVRFGLEMRMVFFLDAHFCPEYLEEAAKVRSDEYYVHMMAAWFFATALAKQYDAALPFLTKYRLDTRTHNKTIQKALESFRITDSQKAYLRTLRVKSSPDTAALIGDFD